MLTYLVTEKRIVGEVREVYVKTSDYDLELLFEPQSPGSRRKLDAILAHQSSVNTINTSMAFPRNGTSNTSALEKVYTLTLMIKSILIETSVFNQF